MPAENVQVFIGPPPYNLVAINPLYLKSLLDLLELGRTVSLVRHDCDLPVKPGKQIAYFDYTEIIEA